MATHSRRPLPDQVERLRSDTIETVSADRLHDKLVWDVGPPAYRRKIISGRNPARTLRKGGGPSGFTRRAESEFGPFAPAPSSTATSAPLGVPLVEALEGERRHVIAGIADGGMSVGGTCEDSARFYASHIGAAVPGALGHALPVAAPSLAGTQ